MDPAPSVTPSSGDPYQFIMNPEKPAGPPIIGQLRGKSFLTKIILIVGGAIIVMIVLAIGVNLLFGDKTNTDDIVALTQKETELVVLAQKGSTATDQFIKSAAANTNVSVGSHKQQWLTFLSNQGHGVSAKDQQATHDATIDAALKDAQQTSTFDETYTKIMRDQLTAYGEALKTAHTTAGKASQRALLDDHYNQVQLLLKQWPEMPENQAPVTSP